MKNHIDKDLLVLAKSVSALDVLLEDDPVGYFHDVLEDLQIALEQPKFIYRAFEGTAHNRRSSLFRVAHSIAGRSFTIGYTHSRMCAARFSDAATFYFWKYRTRCAANPTDDKFTFAPSSAKMDLEQIPDLRKLLEQIESHLQQRYEIKVCSERVAAPRKARVSIYTGFTNKLDGLRAAIEKCNSMLTDYESRLDSIDLDGRSTRADVQSIKAKLNQIHPSTLFPQPHPDTEGSDLNVDPLNAVDANCDPTLTRVGKFLNPEQRVAIDKALREVVFSESRPLTALETTFRAQIDSGSTRIPAAPELLSLISVAAPSES